MSVPGLAPQLHRDFPFVSGGHLLIEKITSYFVPPHPWVFLRQEFKLEDDEVTITETIKARGYLEAIECTVRVL